MTEKVDSLINDSLIKFRVPMKEGPVRIDISEYDLTVHEDFLASIEALDKTYKGGGKLYLSTRMLAKGTLLRSGLGKPWEKFPLVSVAFYFEGKMPTWRESLKLKSEVPGGQ